MSQQPTSSSASVSRGVALRWPRRALLVLLGGSTSACNGCAPSTRELAPDATPTDVAPARGPTTINSGSRLARDDAGHLVPRSSPPPLTPDAAPPKPSREPDWDLDSEDDARDYALRYVRGTERYADERECVELGPSEPQGSRRRVEARTKAGCAGAGTLRDVFLVAVAEDSIGVEDRSRPLPRWPDGSDPDGPPRSEVKQLDDLRKWRAPLADAFRKLTLVPIRAQLYGRGTYLVVTVAGWHGTLTPEATTDDLQAVAVELCGATGGASMGVFAGVDRSRMLRIRCPRGARWDRL